MVLNPSSEFWVAPNDDSSFFLKQPVINNYLLLQRSAEEFQLLHQDMYNTLKYFKQKVNCIQAEIVELRRSENLSEFTEGSISLLSQLLDKSTFELKHALNLFAEFIDVSSIEKPDYMNSNLERPEWTSDESDIDSDDSDI